MQLNSEELKKLQNVCLELACEVDRVCRKNNIEYTLEGGTLIGAVREHGFIAWDDDVDISMSRKEYEKFFEACKTDLNTDRFFLQEHRTDPTEFLPTFLSMTTSRMASFHADCILLHAIVFVNASILCLGKRMQRARAFGLGIPSSIKSPRNGFFPGWMLLPKAPIAEERS